MRPTRKAPRGAVVLGVCALALQVTIGATRPAPTAHAAALPPPPSPPLLALARTFDRLPAAHMLLVYLQAFDNQPGISIPYRELDYGRVIGWLAAALELFECATSPRTTRRSPQRWAAHDAWKRDFMNVDGTDAATLEAKRAEFAEQKAVAKRIPR